MTEASNPLIHRDVRDWAGPFLWALPGVFLAFTSSLGVETSLVVVVAAVALSLLLAHPSGRLGPALPVIPGVAALGILASTAIPGPLEELAAGGAGLLLVLALARAAAEPTRRAAVTPALIVPSLGLGIAFSTALLFPPSQRLVGVATLLLLGAIVVLALLFRRPPEVLEEGGAS